MKRLWILCLCVVLVVTLSGCRRDTTPPEVTSIIPSFGAQEVALNQEITIVFSEAMNKKSVESAFHLDPATEGAFSWSGNTFKFVPQSLFPGTQYDVGFTQAPTDAAGNALGDFSIRFMTAMPGASVYNILSFRWMPDGQSIVYNSDQEGMYGIWQVNVDATGQRRLIESDEHQMDPDASSDGTTIAYVSATSPEVYLYDTNTGAIIKHVVDTKGNLPSWPLFSPDEKYLAFVSVLGFMDAHSDLLQSLHLMDLTRANAPTTNVSPSGETDWVLGFSPDSTKLYLLSTFENMNYGRSFRYDLWAIDLSTKEKERLTVDGPFGNFLTGDLHPGGGAFVYGSWEAVDLEDNIIASPTSLYVVNINPFSINSLTTLGRNAYPQFSPDGTKVVYAADKLSSGKLWELYLVSNLSLDGSTDVTVQQLTITNYPKLFPQWSPDGSQIAFIQVEGEAFSLWVMNSDGGGLRRLTR